MAEVAAIRRLGRAAGDAHFRLMAHEVEVPMAGSVIAFCFIVLMQCADVEPLVACLSAAFVLRHALSDELVASRDDLFPILKTYLRAGERIAADVIIRQHV